MRYIGSILIIVVAVVSTSVTAAAADHWYSDQGLTPLLTDSSKMTIRFGAVFGGDDIGSFVESIDRLVAVVPDEYTVDGFVVCSLSTGVGYNDFLDSIGSLQGVEFVEPYYLSASGSPMLVSENVCVAFEAGTPYQWIDSLTSAVGVAIIDSLPGMTNVYILRNSRASGMRAVEAANYFHGLENVHYAHPDFVAAISLDAYTIYDYYSNYQWQSKKIIGDFNTASVWDFAGLSGADIVVAVIDNGITVHEDLPASRILPGYDFGDLDSVPVPADYENHGMACAGLIGASHSNYITGAVNPDAGIFSISPFVKILPVKIYPDEGNGSTAYLAAAINWARMQGADVLSNSWSFIDAGTEGIPALTEALEVAYAYGRDGLGCAVTFSAGNGGDTIGVVNYPSRLEQCFAVGAVNISDYRFSYSSYGPGLDIVAPSGAAGGLADVWTIDQMGELGKNTTAFPLGCPVSGNDIDYYCKFNGTSAAQPLVAGTAALLLAKDSTLSSSQIYTILRHSAVTSLDWGPITPPNERYGYGRVDAFRAVLSISRGNVNNSADDGIDLQDVMYLVNYLQLGGPAPFPTPLIADVNCDGLVDLSDLIYLTNYLFMGQAEPINPCIEFGD